MPAIPESTRSSIILRLLDHAEKNWPQLAKVRARYHGSFAYITGVLRNGEQIPLFRLRYGGSAHSFGFAIYSAAHDRYQDAVLLTGLPTGSPQEALDTACTVHLAGLGHEPGNGPTTNLRCHPLSLLFNLLLSCWFPVPWRLCRRRGGWQAGGFSRRAASRDLAFRVSV
ncbi:MAG TPA: hypothetical protein VMK84_23080, partial [Streptosporangiaceae bacterium]|nr:hypothetical protein [Streptosporangiaceae bacterium]